MLMRPTEYLPGEYNAIKHRMEADYIANQSAWQTFQAEASMDTRLEAGDPSIMAPYNQQPFYNNRGPGYFNRVRPIVGTVSGYQRRNRKSTIVVPLEGGDQQTADQFTKILLGIYKREGVYETISDAFHHGSCITGMNMLHLYADYMHDPISGDLKVDNIPFNYFFVDPSFKKLDLSDASFIRRRSYLSHTEAGLLMPEYYDAIMALQANSMGMNGTNSQFPYTFESMGISQKNKLTYDEYYYRDYRKRKLLVDKETGETLEITNQTNMDVEEFLRNFPQVTLIEQNIPTVRMAIQIQDKVFYDGPQPLAIDRYPFVPVVGFYNPMMPSVYGRIQGLCRSLRDPQILYNRRIMLNMDMAESVVSTGFFFKENSIIDVKHLFQTGPGRMIPLKEEAQMTDIQPIPAPVIPQGFFQIQETMDRELNLVAGVNEELMGQNADTIAAALSALRQGSGLTTLQPLFDRLDYAQNLLGNLILEAVQANYTPGKIKLILEGEQPADLFYNKSFGKYHCAVENGFNTETQKQMQLAQMIQFMELGMQFPQEEIINAAPLQNKDRIMKAMQDAQQKQQQIQEQQAKIQMEEIQSRTNLAAARAEADRGLGYERMSRVQENQQLAVERAAKAEEDRTDSMLTRVKILKELEDIDFNQLEKLITLSQMLKQSEQANNPQAIQNGSELDRGQPLGQPQAASI